MNASKRLRFVFSLALLNLMALLLMGKVAQADDRPLLITHGSSARPWQFHSVDTLAHIDRLPFSGFTYNIPATWTLMRGSAQKAAPWTAQDLRDQFGELDFSFDNVTENMVSVVVRRNGRRKAEGDFFDDEAWATTVNQFRLLARVASNPKYQCIGIAFDNEEYFEDVWNYPDDVAYADRYSLEQYENKARQRGRQVMRAIQAEWPEAIVLVLHGPYRSTPENRPYEVSMDQVGSADEYELDAPFFFGMAEVADDQKVIDGGEVYQLRSQSEFRINQRWRRNQLPNSVIVPDSLREIYADRVGVTFGLYNETWPTKRDRMSPAIMRNALSHALGLGDDPVWIFTEGTETWLEPGGFPQRWRRAIEGAIDDAQG